MKGPFKATPLRGAVLGGAARSAFCPVLLLRRRPAFTKARGWDPVPCLERHSLTRQIFRRSNRAGEARPRASQSGVVYTEKVGLYDMPFFGLVSGHFNLQRSWCHRDSPREYHVTSQDAKMPWTDGRVGRSAALGASYWCRNVENHPSWPRRAALYQQPL